MGGECGKETGKARQAAHPRGLAWASRAGRNAGHFTAAAPARRGAAGRARVELDVDGAMSQNQEGTAMLRRTRGWLLAGLLAMGLWLMAERPAQAQNYNLDRFYYYPYHLFPHNYWPQASK